MHMCTDLVSIIHSHPTATAREIEHLPLLGFASIGWREDHFEFAWLAHNKVCCFVL